MKAAIVTLPLNHNYGGILQAWALQRTLKNLGIESELLQPNKFRSLSLGEKFCKYPMRAYRKFILHRHVDIHVEETLNNAQRKYFNRDKNVKPFIESRINRRLFNRLKEIRRGEYDLIVIGSDQIWRPRYSVAFDVDIKNSFGWFARKWRKPIISYAASFGLDSLKEFQPEVRSKATLMLNKFACVTVRENDGVRLCRELGADATQVVDPTLLVSKEEYLALISPDIESRKGIMTYVLDETPLSNDIIEKIKATTKFGTFSTLQADGSQVPPLEEWLAGFRDAELVVTDSFHACVFSIIFGKPFIVTGNEFRGNSRIRSLLQLFGLEHHYVTDPVSFEGIDKFRYDMQQIDAIIEREKQVGLNFLRKHTQ